MFSDIFNFFITVFREKITLGSMIPTFGSTSVIVTIIVISRFNRNI